MNDLSAMFGRLHLVFLHLPIGFLILAGVLAIYAARTKTDRLRPAIDLAVAAGALAAFAAAASGWMLSQEGGYEAEILTRHQWLGFATAAGAAVTWWLRHSRGYRPALTATVVLVGLAGHYGGALTHGEDYLFAKPDRETAGVAQAAGTEFAAFIEPILRKKCVSCHNPGKKKGELLLDSPEHIMQGGKNGPVIVAGQPDSSEMLRRVLLPGHDEEHMPPRGKLPLSPEEIGRLRQWIANGASFDAPAQPGQDPAVAETPVFPPVEVEPASAGALEQLRTLRITTVVLGENLPWLAVSATGKKDLDAGSRSALEKVGRQVAHLDLSHSNADDQWLETIGKLPHLTRLALSNTSVSDAGIKKLAALQYLEYLNLTNTAIGDEALAVLAQLPALKSLYLWGTRCSAAAIGNTRQQRPGLHIDAGAPADSSSAPLQLRAPKILYARNIFDDTVQVALDFPFKTISLFYTLDQASPTTQSARYRGEPLVFDQSTTLRAIAAREGWANSPIVQASFVKRKWTPQNVSLLKPPSPKYPGDGALSLYDGKIGETHTDKSYLGYEGEHLTAVLDFGKPVDFSRLSIHYAENNGSWVFAPHGLLVWTSNDGKNWKPCIRARYPAPPAMQETRAGIISEAAPQTTNTRYLKVTVENLLQNPKWHAAPGQKCWVFVDEILVE